MKLGPYSRAVTFQAAPSGAASRLPVTPRACETPAASPLPVAEVGGVWSVLDHSGRTLAPCANETIARQHAAALARLSSR